jgi:pyrroloquinoline quinone biosynthesis protein B
VAVSADGQHWFLLNASPDIRGQIESTPALQPPAGKMRGSPIEAVLLTNADLDHSLGLLLLREGEKLQVHAPANVQRSLTDGISMSPVLASFCGVKWIEPSGEPSPLLLRDGSASGLLCQAFPVQGHSPRFVKRSVFQSGHVVGYRISDEKTGGRLLFLPDVAALEEKTVETLRDCDLLLLDGTFWSEHEMQDNDAGHLTASSMGHVPISGTDGSLRIVAELKTKRKVYVHINNTNPILLEDSPERAAVMAAGCVIGEDGMEFTI